MASFFRKLSDVFTGKYKSKETIDKTKPFWDLKAAQSLEKDGFSEKEAAVFIEKMKQSSNTGDALAVDLKDIQHIGQNCAVAEIVDSRTASFELKQGTPERPRPSYFVKRTLSSSDMKHLQRSADCSKAILSKIAADPSITKVSLTNASFKQDVPPTVLASFIKGLGKTNVQSVASDLEYGRETAVALGEELAFGKIKSVALKATSASNDFLKEVNLKASKLTSFELNSSDLGETCLKTLSDGMPTGLKSLSLTNRPNSPDVVSSLTNSAFIRALPQGLETLKLENVRMDPASETELGQTLQKMPNLKEFVYNGPNVNDETLVALAKGLASSAVEKVDFSEGVFTDKGVNAFLDIMEKSGSKLKETGFLKKDFDFAFCPRRDLSKETIARIQKFKQSRTPATQSNDALAPLKLAAFSKTLPSR